MFPQIEILLRVGSWCLKAFDKVEEIKIFIDKCKESIENLEDIKSDLEKLIYDIPEFMSSIIEQIKNFFNKNRSKIPSPGNNSNSSTKSLGEYQSTQTENIIHQTKSFIYEAIKYKESCCVLYSHKSKNDILINNISNELTNKNIPFMVITPEVLVRTKDLHSYFKLIDEESVNNKKLLFYLQLIDAIRDSFNQFCDNYNEYLNSYEWYGRNQDLNPETLLKKYIIEEYLYKFNNDKNCGIIIIDEIENIFNDIEFPNCFFDIINRLYDPPYNNPKNKKLNFIYFGSVSSNKDIEFENKDIYISWCINKDNPLKNDFLPIISPDLAKKNINIDSALREILEQTDRSPLLVQQCIEEKIIKKWFKKNKNKNSKKKN